MRYAPCTPERRRKRRHDVGSHVGRLFVVRKLGDAARPRQLHWNRCAECRGRSRDDRHDCVGQEHRLLDAVRDHDRRHRPFGGRAEAREVLLEHFPGQGIERPERLVEEEHLRLRRKRACDGDALAHPARELARAPVDGVPEADLLERSLRLRTLLGLRQIRKRRVKREPDVLERREPGQLIPCELPIPQGRVRAGNYSHKSVRRKSFGTISWDFWTTSQDAHAGIDVRPPDWSGEPGV